MATVAPSAAGESAASAKPSAKDQTLTAERQDSGREGRFSAPAPQAHGLSPVSRDIRTAAPAVKPDSADPRLIFGAADSAADMNLVSGEGVCIGIPELIPGRFITVDGMESETEGVYFLSKVTHSFTAEGYYTRFEVKGAKTE